MPLGRLRQNCDDSIEDDDDDDGDGAFSIYILSSK
jgi:hypothetical protein